MLNKRVLITPYLPEVSTFPVTQEKVPFPNFSSSIILEIPVPALHSAMNITPSGHMTTSEPMYLRNRQINFIVNADILSICPFDMDDAVCRKY